MGTHTLTHDAPSLSMFWLNDKNAFRELKKYYFPDPDVRMGICAYMDTTLLNVIV